MATTNGPARLTVTRFAGLDDATVEFEPGVSVVAGRNAADRTPLLWGLAAALGSDEPSFEESADGGRVELAVESEVYTRAFVREGDRVVASGDPYLEDSTTADLFAFLLGSNEARQAVTGDRDLREFVTHSVDTDAVSEEIADLRAERAELDDRIAELSALESERPRLRERRDELDAAVERLEAELADRREALARIEPSAVDADADARRETDTDTPDAEARADRLRELNATLDNAQFELEAQRESLDALDAELGEVESELASCPADPAGELDGLTDELSESRVRKRRLDADITDVQRTLRFNEQFLTSGTSPVATSAGEDGGPDGDGRVVCWTCGTSVPEASIESTLDQLRTLRDDRREERAELTERLERLQERRSELEDQRRRRRDLETRREELRRERTERRARVEDLEARRDDLESDIADLRRDAGAAEADDRAAVLAAHREVTRVEFELERRREERAAVVDDLDSLEAQLDRRADLEARQDGIDDRIGELRGRIERLERAAVSAFNDRMADVLDALEYDRLARLWIERRSDGDSLDDAGATPAGRFVPHIERRTDDGTVYEDVIDHLPASERELIGLVFAVAGYLVHEVSDEVPFFVLDSVEAIDAEHVRRLLAYVGRDADYVVVGLSGENAQGLPDSYRRLRAP
ncbi:chromosome segregation protein SMC [Haloferax sp. Atlit-19N]|uniref:archaea-specific SMC-related protein n=1 Tax=Haloferax sp. Atlit-19N TaxID=2077201 RepID=UPI000E24FD3E|nr:archaea-specific SMC-related protein [Haloferax sp. Atlit-19N]RDZ40106.1 chromosome segregation protein SMC [Haloferax sp. Atlit-19N]